MNKKELRLGNLVNEKLLGEVTIEKIDNSFVDISRSLVLHGKIIKTFHYNILNDDISGITITEEWLRRLGFEINSYRYDPKLYFHRGRFSYTSTNGFMFKWYPLPHIVYVHQLQNLYFALMNEELEVKGEK